MHLIVHTHLRAEVTPASRSVTLGSARTTKAYVTCVVDSFPPVTVPVHSHKSRHARSLSNTGAAQGRRPVLPLSRPAHAPMKPLVLSTGPWVSQKSPTSILSPARARSTRSVAWAKRNHSKFTPGTS